MLSHLFDRIIDPHDRAASVALLRGMLWLPSSLFGAAVGVRDRLYGNGLLRSEQLPVRVISIGGITVGGAGKTPLVRHLARWLVERGQRVVILSRGYGRQGQGVAIVSDGSAVHLDWQSAGDEPFLLASTLPGVPVIVGADRTAAGRVAIQELGATVLLLDDGFQHRRLARDRDIVVLDSTNPFGNGRLLPAGPLREPVTALRRAHAIVLTRVDQGEALDPFHEQVQKLNPAACITELMYRPSGVRSLTDGTVQSIASLHGVPVLALSGIANPRSFEQTLEDAGATLLHRIRFLDHHPFSQHDLRSALRVADQAGARWVVTTEKDAVRLPAGADLSKITVIEIEVKIVKGEEKSILDFGF